MNTRFSDVAVQPLYAVATLLILGIVANFSVSRSSRQAVASGRSSRCALPDPVTGGATTASDDDHGASELK